MRRVVAVLLSVLLAPWMTEGASGQSPSPSPAPESLFVLPPSRVVVATGRVVLWYPIGRRADSGDVRLITGGRERRSLLRVGRGMFVHEVVSLEPGDNRLTLMDDGHELARWSLFFNPAWPGGGPAPHGSTAYRLHGGGTWELCSECHEGAWDVATDRSLRLGAFACASCHRDKARGASLHTPAGDWECLSCHITTGNGTLAATMSPPGTLCATCHGDIVARMASAPVAHGPAAGGYCTACHDPHAGPVQPLLRSSEAIACAGCHPAHGDGTHVIGWTGGRPHPVSGVPDPSRPGRTMACSSCHDPHAARRHLFRDTDVPEVLCRSCHPDGRFPVR